MGGLVSSPSPPPPPPTEEDNRAEERQAREDDLDRKRRGRSGTVHTGWAGALRTNGDSGLTQSTKDRLGE